MATMDPFLGPSRKHFIWIYGAEIAYRAKCALQALNEYKLKSDGSGVDNQTIFTSAIEAVTHAMAIWRLLDSSTALDKTRAKARVAFLNEVWPDLGKAPDGLKNIRNSLEHYEERLDEWVYTSANHNYADFNIGGGISGLDTRDNFRSLIGSRLYFWGQYVDLNEVEAWVRKIHGQVSKTVNARYEPLDFWRDSH